MIAPSDSFTPTSENPEASQNHKEYHYLPIPESVFHSSFYVSAVGQSTSLPDRPYPPSQHPLLYHFNWQEGRVLPEFGFLLVTAGQGLFESKKTGKVAISSGMIALTFPGVWHRYRPDPKVGWTEKWMHFNGEMAHALLEQKVISPGRAVFKVPKARAIENALDGLRARIHRMPVENSLLLSLQALSVLTLSLDNEASGTGQKTAPRERQDPLVDAMLEYIWSRSHHVISVEDVARFLGVARRTLERKTLSVRGHGVLDEIIACRFNRAERLLRETDVPISAVVNLAGFGSDENMRRVFLDRTNLAPAHYRSCHGRKVSPDLMA